MFDSRFLACNINQEVRLFYMFQILKKEVIKVSLRKEPLKEEIFHNSRAQITRLPNTRGIEEHMVNQVWLIRKLGLPRLCLETARNWLQKVSKHSSTFLSIDKLWNCQHDSSWVVGFTRWHLHQTIEHHFWQTSFSHSQSTQRRNPFKSSIFTVASSFQTATSYRKSLESDLPQRLHSQYGGWKNPTRAAERHCDTKKAFELAIKIEMGKPK